MGLNSKITAQNNCVEDIPHIVDLHPGLHLERLWGRHHTDLCSGCYGYRRKSSKPCCHRSVEMLEPQNVPANKTYT